VPWAVQKRMNRLRCHLLQTDDHEGSEPHLICGSLGPPESSIQMEDSGGPKEPHTRCVQIPRGMEQF